MDIVEKEGKPVAKRGKLGGKKEVWRCDKCLLDYVLLEGEHSPSRSLRSATAVFRIRSTDTTARPTAAFSRPDEAPCSSPSNRPARLPGRGCGSRSRVR